MKDEGRCSSCIRRLGSLERGENQANDHLLGSGFLARGGWFFNNLAEVKPHHGSTRGVAGFRLYVSPIAVAFDGDGSNTSAEVHLELNSLGGDLEGLKL